MAIKADVAWMARLEPMGLERTLVTAPMLRKVDSSGRVFISTEYKDKEMLIIAAYLEPDEGDKERFLKIGRQGVRPFGLGEKKFSERKLAIANELIYRASEFDLEASFGKCNLHDFSKNDLKIFDGVIIHEIIDGYINNAGSRKALTVIGDDAENLKTQYVKEILEVYKIVSFANYEVEEFEENYERYKCAISAAIGLFVDIITKKE